MTKARREFLLGASAVVSAGIVSAVSAVSAQEPAPEPQSKPLKILGISTSHRTGKTTTAAVNICLESIKSADPNITTELIELAGMKLNFIVPGADTPVDDFGKILDIVKSPQFAGLVIGTPVYFGAMSGMCKAMIDRFMIMKKDSLLQNKVFGAIAIGGNRNGGQELTVNSLRNCLSSQQVVLAQDAPPTSHWGATLWNQGDDISKDEFGISTAKNLGVRLAELARMISNADSVQWVSG